ncbi:MAG TPA: ATP-binding protein, partial [Casimicrobiaceae bacterium]
GAVETARPTAEAKRVALEALVDPLAGMRVEGDAHRLQQVLWNLLSNAIKFTPGGGSVVVALRGRDGRAEISVGDTGEGIAEPFLPFVFDRFRQADASTTRRHGGLGLGLSIVKQLVEMHGGTVAVKSPGVGRGTTFVVTLPMRPEPLVEKPQRRRPDDAPAPVAITDDGERLAGIEVLVVDDDPDARELVARLLEDCRARVTMAGSAAEALEALERRRFDVLVSDIGMPGEDGYTLLRRVRELPADRNGAIPAMALTAYARGEDRVKAMRAGFQMHAAKPVEPGELVAVVASLARRF